MLTFTHVYVHMFVFHFCSIYPDLFRRDAELKDSWAHPPVGPGNPALLHWSLVFFFLCLIDCVFVNDRNVFS